MSSNNNIIPDKTPLGGVFIFSTTDYIVEEGNTVTITVERIGVTQNEASVTYVTRDDTAIGGLDYTAKQETLTFKPGDTIKTIKVPILNDDIAEGTEEFSVVLENPTNGARLGSRHTARIRIRQNGDIDHGILSLNQSSYSVYEHEETVWLEVIREGGAIGTVTVDVHTFDETAMEWGDYEPINMTVTFAPDEWSQMIPLTITNNPQARGNRTLRVELSNETGGAQLGRDAAHVTIIDVDMPSEGYVQFTQERFTVVEGIGLATIRAFRSGLLGKREVHYQTIDVGGGAIPDADYVPTSGTLTFQDGESEQYFTVGILPDQEPEADEWIGLRLKNLTNKDILGERREAILVIQDDDAPDSGIIQFGSPQGYIVKGYQLKRIIDLLRKQGMHGAITANYGTLPDTAFEGVDYHPITGTLIFENNVKEGHFAVAILPNSNRRDDRSLTLELDQEGNGTTIPKQRTFLTIRSGIPENVVVFQFIKDNYDVNEDGGSIDITLERLGKNRDSSFAVTYSIADGTTNVDGDSGGKLIFEKGEWHKSFRIPITDNDEQDGDRMINLLLLEVEKIDAPEEIRAELGRYRASLTIRDDERGMAQVDGEHHVVFENVKNGVAKIKVVRYGEPSEKSSVRYRTIGGSAIVGMHYQHVSSILWFEEGETWKEIEIPIFDNRKPELDRTVGIELFRPDNVELGTHSKVYLRIIDNDLPMVKWAQQHFTMNEQEHDQGKIRIPIHMNMKVRMKVRIGYVVKKKKRAQLVHNLLAQESAVMNDTEEITGVITFEPGTTEEGIDIDIASDQEFRDDQEFEVELRELAETEAGVKNAMVVEGNGRATIIVQNDNGPQSITLEASPQQLLADGQSTITVTATVHNQHRLPISNHPVWFSTSRTPNQETRYTNSNGQATFVLTATTEPGIVKLYAETPISKGTIGQVAQAPSQSIDTGSSILSSQVAVEFLSVVARTYLPMLVTSAITDTSEEQRLTSLVELRVQDRTVILQGDGKTIIPVTVGVIDRGSNQPVSQEAVTVTTDHGVFATNEQSMTVTTNMDGKAVVNLQVADAGRAIVRASVASNRSSGRGFAVISVVRQPIEILLTAASATGLELGEVGIVEAQTRDSAGQVITLPIHFRMEHEDGEQKSVDVAMRSGAATWNLICERPGRMSVTAWVGSLSSAPVVLQCEPPIQMTMRGEPTTLTAHPENRSVITIEARNRNGTPVVGETVEVTTTRGVVTPLTTKTDETGKAVVTLSNPDMLIGEMVVTAQIGDISEPLTIVSKSSGEEIKESTQNGDPARALTLEPGTYRIGSEHDQPGTDYYRFELTEPSEVILTVQELPLGSDYDVQIVSANRMRMVAEGKQGGNADEVVRVRLLAGLYYVNIDKVHREGDGGYVLGFHVQPWQPEE